MNIKLKSSNESKLLLTEVKKEITIDGVYFKNPYKILEVNKGLPMKESLIHIKVKNCFFSKGLIFNLDHSLSNVTSVFVDFDGCIILQKEHMRKDFFANYENRYLKFFNCFIDELNLTNVNLDNLLFWNSYVNIRAIHAAEINYARFYNVVGNMNLHRIKHVEIEYGNISLYIRCSEIIRYIKEFFKQRNLSIFDINTKFQVSEAKSITFYQSFYHYSDEPEVFISTDEDNSKILNYILPMSKRNSPKISLVVNDSIDTNEIRVERSKINMLEIRDDFHGKLTLNQVDMNFLSFRDVRLNEFLIRDIGSIGTNGLINFHKSSFTNGTFDNVDFDSFEVRNFYKSSFADNRYFSCSIGLDIKASSLSDASNFIDKRSEYDNYRQLKKEFEKNEDLYWTQIMKKKLLKSLSGISDVGLDSFILNLNYCVSRNGTDLKRVSSWIIVMALLFYGLFTFLNPIVEYSLVCDGDFRAVLQRIGWVMKVVNFKVIWTLINPVHRASDLSLAAGFDLNGGHYCVSFFARIVMSYLYYEFISSFRKYTKIMKN